MPPSSAGAVSRRRSRRVRPSSSRPQVRPVETIRPANSAKVDASGSLDSVASAPVDAATVAAQLQLQTERREKLCSALALGVKFGLVVLGAVSLVKLSFAYQERLDRHGELAAVVDVESGKLRHLQQRFDRLFTLGGDRRLMDEQDQWIAPNRLRVIWR